MTPDIEDTIVAIASAPGGSLRGIIRVAGPNTVACLASIFSSSETPEDPAAWTKSRSTNAFQGTVKLCANNSPTNSDQTLNKDKDKDKPASELPVDLLLWPTTQSYTRQPTAELHTIGSAPLLKQVVEKICQSGARLANPGEFTLRAFLSGRIDMTQAEAVLAVIDSDGEDQMNTALRQLAGGLAGPLSHVRDLLMGTLAELEAGLDFVEEDIEFITEEELTRQLTESRDSLQSVSAQILSRDLDIASAKVVLFGMPNSGKSSLFNRMTNSDTAIVTDIEGTTTDFVSTTIELEGMTVELVDTAGFETSDDKIKTDSQSLRAEQEKQAVVRLHCIDGSQPLTSWDREQLSFANPNVVVVITKSDLLSSPAESQTHSDVKKITSSPVALISSVNADGLEHLAKQIQLTLIESQHGQSSVVGSTVVRASQSLKEAYESVKFALDAVQQRSGEELVASEIRRALEGLGQVAGTVYTDDILDLVFGRFCIGK